MSKTHYKKIKNTNYIGSWDLYDQNGNVVNKTVTITKVEKQMVHDGRGGQEECPIIHLKECKPLVANSTNLKMIARVMASDFIEDWIGKQIKLTVKQVKAFGEVHDAIRVMEDKGKPEMKASAIEQAIEHIKKGTVTIEQIQNKYSLTSLQLKKLQDAKN